MALDAGEVHRDAYGYSGASLNRAFRLIDAPASRAALRESLGVVALIVSDWFFEEVVRHHTAAEPSCFHQVRVVIKETDVAAWVRILEDRETPSQPDTGQLVPVHGRPAGDRRSLASWPSAGSAANSGQRLDHRLGAWITKDQEGVEFAIFARDAEAVALCFVDDDGNEQRHLALSRLPDTEAVWYVYARDVGAGQRYGYRVSGEYQPSSGHRFNPHKLLLDPYARAITGKVNWAGPRAGPVFGYHSSDTVLDPGDSAPYVPHSVVVDGAFNWEDDKHPNIPWVDTVIYETHVRGFTIQHPLVPEEQRGTYAGMGSEPVIGYLKDLGITSLQLMPIHHFVSEHSVIQRGQTDYWGYNPIGYFAPEEKYSSSGTAGAQVREFKAMVRNLHKAGIEVILDVDFSHTAEGNHEGPHLSFRGIANRTYYLLEHDPSRYKKYSGCGSTLNMADPPVLALAMDSLRYWVMEMHVDGFHFDLASGVARCLYEAGCLNKFFDEIRNDPVISKVKLIAESWDLGESGGYQVKSFPSMWGELNDRYRDAVRRFWRGASQPLEELAHRLTGSVDLCWPEGPGPISSINFITYHDGFTLSDLVSYNSRHNAGNGENNQDGIDFNDSWNCGTEGPTDNPEILGIRERQQRNFLATLFLSAGVPMLLAGDELGRTQNGNNNPYCQDNKITWVDWGPYERGDALLQFTKDLIALRAKYRIFRRRKEFRGSVIRNTGAKDVIWFTPRGKEIKQRRWVKRNVHALGIFLNGQAVFDRSMQSERKSNDSFLLLFNGSAETIRFTLPGRPGVPGYLPIINTESSWVNVVDTAAPGLGAGDIMRLKARSMAVLKYVSSEPVTYPYCKRVLASACRKLGRTRSKSRPASRNCSRVGCI